MQQCSGKDLLRASEEDDEADPEMTARADLAYVSRRMDKKDRALLSLRPRPASCECHCSYFGTTPQATRPLPPPFSGWSL
jgi:hypothetical protein